MRSWAWLVLLSACSAGSPELEIFFADELVEARARTLRLRVVRGETCSELLTRPFSEAPKTGSVFLEREGPWPPEGSSRRLDGVPGSESVSVDLSVRTADDFQVGRSCQDLVLSSSPDPVYFKLNAATNCQGADTSLEVAVLLDTSNTMEILDPEFDHLQEIIDVAIRPRAFPATTRWSLTTFGHDGRVMELLPPTTSLDALDSTLDGLRNAQSGGSILYEGIYRGATKLRDRDVCGTRQGVLLVAGGGDLASERVFEEAQIQLVGVRGDATDDLFVAAVALSPSGYETLNEMIPDEIGVVSAGETQSQRRFRLGEAGLALRALVAP